MGGRRFIEHVGRTLFTSLWNIDELLGNEIFTAMFTTNWLCFAHLYFDFVESLCWPVFVWPCVLYSSSSPCHPVLHSFSFWSALTLLAFPSLCSLGFLRWNSLIFTWFPTLFPLSFFLSCYQNLSSVSEWTCPSFSILCQYLLGSGMASPSSVLTTQPACPADTFNSTLSKMKLTISLPNQLLLIPLLPLMASIAQSSFSLTPTFNQLLLQWFLISVPSILSPRPPH